MKGVGMDVLVQVMLEGRSAAVNWKFKSLLLTSPNSKKPKSSLAALIEIPEDTVFIIKYSYLGQAQALIVWKKPIFFS